MEMAKVTSKGQITIPVSIRKRLGINEGDKLLFIDSPDGVVMVNPDMLTAGQNAALQNASEEPSVSPDARTGAPQRSVVSPRVKPPADGKAAGQSSKAEPRARGLDVGALLDEIRSIGSSTLK